MPIVTFLAKRLAAVVLILLLVSFLVFSLLALSPVSQVSVLLGSRPATAEAIAGIKARYHLNDPFLLQYWHWLVGVIHGDFGQSVQSGLSVTSVIASRIAVTLELGLYAFVLVVVLGIPAGLAAGVWRGRMYDRASSALTIIGMSTPGFAVGILLIYLFGVRLDLFPVYSAGSSQLVDRVEHLTMPAVALAIALGALIFRQARAASMDVMEQDYVAFARARGVGTARILTRYLLRNTAVPITTAAGLLLIAAVSGTVLIETIFSIPGIGMLMVQSIEVKDVPVVQGLTLFVALAVLLINLLVDAATLAIDPRTRVTAKG